MKRLPVKLSNEPLLEATCEIRVATRVGLHTVLPGYLIAKLGIDPTTIEQLPAHAIPEPIRAREPELMFAPLVRMKWGQYQLLVGHRIFAISNPAPYVGWTAFKKAIGEVFRTVLQSGFLEGVNRYSIKYVNFFAENSTPSARDALEWAVSVGPFDLTGTNVTLRAEVKENEFLTVITAVSSAVVQVPSEPAKSGAVLDLDTIMISKVIRVDDFLSSLDDRLQTIRTKNKQVFFESIRDEAIAQLGPVYE